MDSFADVACVVRTVGERTTGACISLLENFFGAGAVAIVSREPFSAALRASLETGITLGKPWTLVIDADVLIHAPGLAAMLRDRHALPERTFMHHASVMDKFFRRYRRAGNRLYRTACLPVALGMISTEKCLRPERDLCQAMLENGYRNFQSYRIVGIHDYGQYYRDILRKMVLFSAKHQNILDWLRGVWAQDMDDMDFRAAMDGLDNADSEPAMEVGLKLLHRLPDRLLGKWEALEKKALHPGEVAAKDVEELLKSELALAGITPTSETAPREYASCVE